MHTCERSLTPPTTVGSVQHGEAQGVDPQPKAMRGRKARAQGVRVHAGTCTAKKVRVKPNVPAMKYSDGTTYKYKGVNYVAKKFAVWKPVPQKKKGMKTVVLKKVVAPAKRAPTAAEKKRLDKIKAATAATAFKNAEVLTRRRAAQEKRAAAVAEKMKGPNAVNATSAFLKRLGGR